jgi:predicted Zn finger-like uncharacterized protein
MTVTCAHWINPYKPCPKCGGTRFVVKNYDIIWRDGDVHCADCDTYVRVYDAG